MNPTLKKYLILGGIYVATIVVAFAFGRYNTEPSKVETKVVEVEKQVVVEKIDEKKLNELIEQNKQFRTQLSELKKSIHREKWEAVHVDGSKELKETEDINVSKVVKEQEIKYVDSVQTVTETKVVTDTKYVDRVLTQTKVVEAAKPDWKLTPMVGVDVTKFSLRNPLGIMDTLDYGGSVEHRIIGPIFGGLWGLKSGQVGLSVSAEF